MQNEHRRPEEIEAAATHQDGRSGSERTQQLRHRASALVGAASSWLWDLRRADCPGSYGLTCDELITEARRLTAGTPRWQHWEVRRRLLHPSQVPADGWVNR